MFFPNLVAFTSESETCKMKRRMQGDIKIHDVFIQLSTLVIRPSYLLELSARDVCPSYPPESYPPEVSAQLFIRFSDTSQSD